MWAHSLFPKANFDDFIKLSAKTGPAMRPYRTEWVSIEQRGVFGNEELDLLNSFATELLEDSAEMDNADTIDNEHNKNGQSFADPFLEEYSDNDDLFVSRNSRGRNVIDDDDDDDDLFVTNRNTSTTPAPSTTPSTENARGKDNGDDGFPDDDELEDIMRNEQSKELDEAEEEAAMEFGF
ncbi:hypothetical protein TRVA0_003S00694 [Trichomonascus vanleenenianus]|uniref:Csm3p n=1 Tax=Trichomonascus vanleenenianus TaxID=2268995 RepID=UPI003ECB36DC